MTLRTCPVCGVLERRQRDMFNRETTNLCPFTSKCVDCLCKSVPAKVMTDFDPRKAAANDREDTE